MTTAIKLLSKDGKEFEVARKVACRSETVKNMVEGEPGVLTCACLVCADVM